MGLCWGKEYIPCPKPSEQTQASLLPSQSPQEDFPETKLPPKSPRPKELQSTGSGLAREPVLAELSSQITQSLKQQPPGPCLPPSPTAW